MKSIYLSSRTSKKIESKNEEINNLETRITKELLEKYKPKVNCKLKRFSEIKVQWRVA